MKLDQLGVVGGWLGCRCKNQLITGFAIDSRAVRKGNLFFALKGAKFDGHDFLNEVRLRGGIAAVVDRSCLDRSCQGEVSGLEILRVENVQRALQHLAKEVQRRRGERAIGVTGSVGKSTVKDFISELLAQKWSVTKTPGNSNSQVGVPLSILNSSGEGEVFVVEMGMSYSGEIETLVDIVPLEGAVITKIGHSHIESFTDGLEGVARAKAEILSGVSTKWAVIGYEAFQYPQIREAGKCDKLTYGVGPVKADVVLQGDTILCGQDKSPPILLPFSETHFRENAVAAVAVARQMGLSWEEIMKGIAKLKPMQLRFEKFQHRGTLFINDCYNASPESMIAALNNLPKPSLGGKTIMVFGEMTGLGLYSEAWHKKVGEEALKRVDHLLCYGKGCAPVVELFCGFSKPVKLYNGLEELRKAMFELAAPGDVVLVKGSNHNQLWRILEPV